MSPYASRRLLRAGCHRALGAFVALAVWSGAGAAQSAASLSVGASRVTLVDAGTFTSATVSPAVWHRASNVVAGVSGTLSQVGAAGWSSQGVAQAAWFTPVSAGGWLAELGGSAGGSAFPGGASTAQLLGSARVHWLGRALGAWGGAGGGAMYDGLGWRSVRQLEAGFTGAGRTWRGSAAVIPTRTDDTLRYTDGVLSLSTAFGASDLVLQAGGRSGAALPIAGGERRAWGSVQVSWWLAPRLALQASGGTYPVDPTQGFPAGEFVSLGLRVGERRRDVAASQAAARRTRAVAAASGVTAFRVRLEDADVIAIAVRAPRAQRVEVQGDLTRWMAVPLVQASDGWWWLRVPRGGATVVELLVRVDGRAWVVPPGTEPTRDEFGGMSGRVVLPPE